jgi:hypothetical protein
LRHKNFSLCNQAAANNRDLDKSMKKKTPETLLRGQFALGGGQIWSRALMLRSADADRRAALVAVQ